MYIKIPVSHPLQYNYYSYNEDKEYYPPALTFGEVEESVHTKLVVPDKNTLVFCFLFTVTVEIVCINSEIVQSKLCVFRLFVYIFAKIKQYAVYHKYN